MMKARTIKTHVKYTRKYCKNDQPAGKQLHINIRILGCMLHHVNLRTAKYDFEDTEALIGRLHTLFISYSTFMFLHFPAQFNSKR